MALILNIDTSTETASVCLAKDGRILLLQKNDQQKDHAAWLHVAIKQTMGDAGTALAKIDAVAVTIGPGSYTGLRVGLAAAKGICYALEKPLITVNTLLVMATASKHEQADLLCPMIDARRMEVFTAIYTKELKVVKEPVAMVIDENSFKKELESNSICFTGSGSKKFQAVNKAEKAIFSAGEFDASHMTELTELLFKKNQFADLAYTEPLYLKEFYTPAR
jgi:tRNA threonylcarbamoyladenosine biosynthesis protein TsaB